MALGILKMAAVVAVSDQLGDSSYVSHFGLVAHLGWPHFLVDRYRDLAKIPAPTRQAQNPDGRYHCTFTLTPERRRRNCVREPPTPRTTDHGTPTLMTPKPSATDAGWCDRGGEGGICLMRILAEYNPSLL
jgi:hypothetical protein